MTLASVVFPASKVLVGGDMAHLVNFAGTDTVIGIDFAQHFYEATLV
jgi:hypothetical protein